MRKIKFRTWDEYDKKWIYFSLESLFDALLKKKKRPEIVKLWHARNYELKIYKYTGLKDKDNKEIWEGDIISYGEDKLCPIVFDEEAARFQARKFYVFSLDNPWNFTEELFNIEVVGNIYENSELLEEEK